MDTLLQDIRVAVRKLLKAPGFTAVAVATLALAIGSTTAIFSVLNGVIFKPLPFAEPQDLVRVSSTKGGKNNLMSVMDFIDIRSQSKSFVGMVPLDNASVNLTGNAIQPQRLSSARVGANFFQILGVQPQLGRAFAAGEDSKTASRVIMLSDALWRTRFGADRTIIGRSISIDGNPYTVIGVTPAKFAYPDKPDVWVPFVWQKWEDDPENRGAHSMGGIARLKPGVTIDRARADVASAARALEKQYPKSNTGFGATVQNLHDQIIGDVRPALFAMLGAVGFVLLIACANIANLLLVRAADREAEMAVRTALGASRSRLMRQLMTESVLLSVVGAAVGALLASWAVKAVVAFGPTNLPRLDEVTVDGSVLLFTAAVAIVTGLLFGLAPTLYAMRSEISAMLRRNMRGSSRGGIGRTRNALVTAEIALAVVLLVGAGLLIRSFASLMRVDPGFRTEHVVAFSTTLPGDKYKFDRHILNFTGEVEERLRHVPGTQEVGVSFSRPLARGRMRTIFNINGRPDNPPGSETPTEVFTASPGYFSALGLTLMKGRLYTLDEDRPDRANVVVVNQEFVRRYFPNENPIGQRLRLGITHDTADTGTEVTAGGEIVGVVKDVKSAGLATENYPATYIPFSSLPFTDVTFIVRSSADPKMLQNAIQAQLREVDRDLPIFDLSTMEKQVAESVSQPRFYMLLLGTFAGIALVLAALGIYGVISYAVSQRTRELGIRIALGAPTDRVIRLVLAQGMMPIFSGIIAGLVATMWLTRLIASLLFGVGALDPLTLAAVPVVLMGVAVMACLIPARRAARVDPVLAMRAE